MTSVYRVITVGAQTAYSCVLPGTSYGSTRTNWPWGRATLGGGGGGDVIVPKVDGKDSLGTCDENKIGHLTSFEGTETRDHPSAHCPEDITVSFLVFAICTGTKWQYFSAEDEVPGEPYDDPNNDLPSVRDACESDLDEAQCLAKGCCKFEGDSCTPEDDMTQMKCNPQCD